jgi:hypothetical protein
VTFGPVVRRQMLLAERAAQGEMAAWQRAQDAATAERAEAHEHAALQAAQQRAEAAGDAIDALALARGQVPARTLADVLGEAAAAADRTVRDPAAEYGSEANPAFLVDGADLGAARRFSAEDDGQLDRAQAMHGDTFMAVMVARYERRQAKTEMARSQPPPPGWGAEDWRREVWTREITRGVADAFTGIR